jgi:hypothetical protein
MLKIAMSAAASGVLRALIGRAGVPRDRILLTDIQSTDWQSLTFVGERHRICLRVTAPDSDAIARRLADGIEDAEFAISGQIMADIHVTAGPEHGADGSTALIIEALTIED